MLLPSYLLLQSFDQEGHGEDFAKINAFSECPLTVAGNTTSLNLLSN